MRILGKLLSVVLAFGLMVLAIAWFLPAHFKTEVRVEINQSLADTRKEFGDTAAWAPETQIRIGDTLPKEGQTGAFLPLRNDSLVYEGRLVSLKPIELHSTERWTFEATESGSAITWTSEGLLPYPIGRLYGLMFGGLRESHMQARLDSLRVFMESEMDVPPKPVEEHLLEHPE